MAVIAWQGWKLNLPEGWNPLRLEGDYDRGQALFVDLERPRLGLRWDKPRGQKFDAQRAIEQALKQEVGQLAAAEAARCGAGTLYLEPKPPGRDVWIGYSAPSGRLLQIVY